MMQGLRIPCTGKFAELSPFLGCVCVMDLGHYLTYFSGPSPRSWPADKA